MTLQQCGQVQVHRSGPLRLPENARVFLHQTCTFFGFLLLYDILMASGDKRVTLEVI